MNSGANRWMPCEIMKGAVGVVARPYTVGPGAETSLALKPDGRATNMHWMDALRLVAVYPPTDSLSHTRMVGPPLPAAPCWQSRCPDFFGL